MTIFPVVSSYHVNTVGENIIGAPKKQNIFLYPFKGVFFFLFLLLPI